MAKQEIYDLLIITDATYSMSDYLAALQTALPQVISISSLTDAFDRIGLLAYRDYCDRGLLEWSGWLDQSRATSAVQSSELLSLAGNLEPIGGGDYPEALKTALARGYELMREDATTLILLYTDAPPHSSGNGTKRDLSSNWMPEQTALLKNGSYGGYGPAFADWISACNKLHYGPKKGQVFAFVDQSAQTHVSGYYQYLSLVTRGMCVYLKNPRPLTISQATVETLLAWMGVSKAGAAGGSIKEATLARFIHVNELKAIKNEDDAIKNRFFDHKYVTTNTAEVGFTAEVLKKHLPKRGEPLQDFARRYAQDGAYKEKVVRELSSMIERDVSAITLNPIFGSLWRAVCNDRENENRDGLISAFGLQVERIKDDAEKTRMKQWLEESYDYTAEVLEAIESVEEEDRYPCVMLDPTLMFSRPNEAKANATTDEDRDLLDFRRDELLEIGRSCDYKILRRLGKVLTRLTIVESANDLPEHLANADKEAVPRLPMALAQSKYGRKFWRFLLHLVVPGTMLAARPAALLAALTLKLGVAPLSEPAIREMALWRDRWNNIEIPETWNVSCMSLLLDADKVYRAMLDAGLEQEAGMDSLLLSEDRAMFDRLASYKMLELNMNTDLTANVPWTPSKTTLPLGPVVRCRVCKFPRSVTMMGPNERCGLCIGEDWASKAVKEAYTTNRVSAEDTASTPAIWVECSTQTCRSQYVVYNPQALNIRPRCHYCREQSTNGEKSQPAPWVECRQCQNRVIWPVAYRTADASDFTCVACTSGHKTVVEEVTTANKLSEDNGRAWLLKNDDKIKEPFNGRSVFHTISTAGTEDFCQKVHLFPSDAPQVLTWKGKPIFNSANVREQLMSWVSGRKTELGTCSLCFSSIRKTDLHPSCGRSGCHQRVCADCLQGWYGLNSVGRIINTGALACAFCRRAPSAKTLASYGMGVHALGNLASAVRERGTWIYAWCQHCAMAKRYMERVCARGAPPDIAGFGCEECEAAIRRRETMKTVEVHTMDCPGCGVATHKTYGCGHISCPVRGCGVHWCYYCGKEFDPDGIYDHMSQEHSGYFAA